MDEAIEYFLALRIQFRRNPEARAIIDRCLSLIAEARQADHQRLTELEGEVETLSAELAARFGAKGDSTRH